MFNSADLKPNFNFVECPLTPAQKTNFDALKTIIMRDHPFFSFILLERLKLVFTKSVPTAATDGVRFILMNPDYISKLPMKQQVFAFVHEIAHCIWEHLPRQAQYRLVQAIHGVRIIDDLANIAQDARINFDLVRSGVGEINKNWVYDKDVQPDETWETIYARYFKQLPPPPPGGGQGPGGSGAQGQSPQNPQAGQNQTLPWHGQSMDVHLPPPTDPATGQPVEPDQQGMKETVLQAWGFAKNQGKEPAGFQRWIDELLDPQVPWEDHLLFVMAKAIGGEESSYRRLHRRKLGTAYKGFQMIYPGKIGHAAGGVVFACDTSGSMGEKELETGASEAVAVLDEHKPAWFKTIWCDAAVGRIDEDIETGEDFLAVIKEQGVPGGGGTDFRPVFDAIDEMNETPSLLVFFTDGHGTFPDEAPSYPVLWVLTTDVEPPFGDSVKVEVRS